MAVAPLAQGFNVLRRSKRGGAGLASLEHHGADLAGRDAVFGQRTFEELETGVLGPIAVGERDLDEAGIEYADPFLQNGNCVSPAT